MRGRSTGSLSHSRTGRKRHPPPGNRSRVEGDECTEGELSSVQERGAGACRKVGLHAGETAGPSAVRNGVRMNENGIQSAEQPHSDTVS